MIEWSGIVEAGNTQSETVTARSTSVRFSSDSMLLRSEAHEPITAREYVAICEESRQGMALRRQLARVDVDGW